MLKEYIRAAMGRAKYEILTDENSFYGEIPDCNGVYATAQALEECREELEEVLEEWLLFSNSQRGEAAMSRHYVSRLFALGSFSKASATLR